MYVNYVRIFLSFYLFRWQELYSNHYLPFCARLEGENIEGLPMTSSSFFAARKEHRPYYKKHRKVYSEFFILFMIKLMTFKYIGKKYEMEAYWMQWMCPFRWSNYQSEEQGGKVKTWEGASRSLGRPTTGAWQLRLSSCQGSWMSDTYSINY